MEDIIFESFYDYYDMCKTMIAECQQMINNQYDYNEFGPNKKIIINLRNAKEHLGIAAKSFKTLSDEWL